MSSQQPAIFSVELRTGLEKAGGVFVKLGQLLAIRPDLIPSETAFELGKLHQDVIPVRRHILQPVLENLLGGSIEDISGSHERAMSVARRIRTGEIHLNGAGPDLDAPFGVTNSRATAVNGEPTASPSFSKRNRSLAPGPETAFAAMPIT